MTEETAEDAGGVVQVSREDVIRQRRAILDRYGLTLAEVMPREGDCSCCPPEGVVIPPMAWNALRTLGWVLDAEPNRDCGCSQP